MKLLKKIISGVLALTMLSSTFGVLPMTASAYTIPSVTPPANQHPRVLFRASDVETIKANLDAEENANAKAAWSNYCTQANNTQWFDGNPGGEYDQAMLAKIEAAAFDYVINGDETSGKNAVTEVMTYVANLGSNSSAFGSTEDDVTRNVGSAIYTLSEIYDWCYPLFTAEQLTTIRETIERIAGYMEIGWPPNDQSAVNGHGAESQLLRSLLAYAIAAYDEDPSIWNTVAGRFYDEYVPVREYLLKGQYNLEGDNYGLYRHMWDSWAYLLITGMGADAPYNATNLASVGYGQIYMRRPDGQLLRDGDTTADSKFATGEYWNDYALAYIMDSAINNDPYLKQEYIRRNDNMKGSYEMSSVLKLIVNDTTLQAKSLKNLPLSRYFGGPVGMSIARTGWNDGMTSSDVVAEMKVGVTQLGNHQHLDAGHFQIYYKGILASDSGVYEAKDANGSIVDAKYDSDHHAQYSTKSVAHNTMLILDSDERGTLGAYRTNRTTIRDGGQTFPSSTIDNINYQDVLNGDYTTASVEAQEIDPVNDMNPEYTYLKGDLSGAYSASKINTYKRSFMFLNTGRDDVPGVMVIFDKVDADSASDQKIWQMHGLNEPTISGNQTVFTNTEGDYNGKMTVDTLLPAEATITKMGDGDAWDVWDNGNWKSFASEITAGKTDEGKTWRMQLSPTTNAKQTYFLNVIQVSDADKSDYLATSLIDASAVYGAQVADRVVTFSKTGSEITNTVSFAATGEGTLKYTLTDMAKGTWAVTVGGTSVGSYIATEEGGVLSFTASAGDVVATKTSDSTTGANTYDPTPGTATIYQVIADGKFINTPVAPEVVDDTTVNMALSAFADYYGLTYGEVINGQVTVTDGELTQTVDATEESGEIVVNAKALLGYFGGGLIIDETKNTIELKTLKVEYSIDGGETWTRYPYFNGGTEDQLDDPLTTENFVQLPANTTSVMLRGVKANDSNDFTWRDLPYFRQNASDWANGYPVGYVYGSGTAPDSYYTNIITGKSKLNNTTVPLRDGEARVNLMFEEVNNSGESTNHYIMFRTELPELTSLTANTEMIQEVKFVNAGAFNNNKSMLGYANNNNTVYLLGNISKSLEGAGMFILPKTAPEKNGENLLDATKLDQPLFTFTAEEKGKLVVLMKNDAAAASQYKTDTATWSTGSGHGTVPSGLTIDGNQVKTSRTWNDYSNEYFATVIKWRSTNTEAGLGYVFESPALDGNTKSDHVSGVGTLQYAYVRAFEAGETVSVYNTGSLVRDDSLESVFVPLVIWGDTTIEEKVEGEVTVEYSIDNGETWEAYPYFDQYSDQDEDPLTTDLYVQLPANTLSVMLRAASTNEFDELTFKEKPYIVDTTDMGGNYISIVTDETDMIKDNTLPLVRGENRAMLYYTPEGGERTSHALIFKTKTPNVTSLTANTDLIPGVKLVTGAAAWNNNKSVQGYMQDFAYHDGDRAYVVANISKSLEGASMFVLSDEIIPSTMKESANKNAELFRFTADEKGKLVVLMGHEVGEDSPYKTDRRTWKTGAGHGESVSAMEIDDNYYSKPRTYNDYTNEYYAMGIKWKIEDSTGTAYNNQYIFGDPGVYNNTSSAKGVADLGELKYAYVRYFEAGEEVIVYNPGNFESSNIADNLVVPMVVWGEEAPAVDTSLTVSYSTDDGASWTPIDGFDANIVEYDITLSENTNSVKLKAEYTNADGSVVMKVEDTYDDTKEDILAGFAYQPFGDGEDAYAADRHYAETRMANDGIVPIKNEKGKAYLTYSIYDEEIATYTFRFTAEQQQLAYFKQADGFTDGNVTYISGGAASNDNGTLIDSVATGGRMWALANISESLEGASMFVLPWKTMFADSSVAMTDPDAEFFSFAATRNGTVTVLMAQEAAADSDYAQNWSLVNEGTEPAELSLVNDTMTARNWNEYEEPEYYATAFKWVSNKDGLTYRTENPGLTGEMSNTYYTGAAKLTYAYQKEFAAGDVVTIYNTGSMVMSSEASALMPVLVTWGDETIETLPDEAVEPLKLEYSIDGGVTWTQFDTNYDDDISGDGERHNIDYGVNLPDNITTVKVRATLAGTGDSGYFMQIHDYWSSVPNPILGEDAPLKDNGFPYGYLFDEYGSGMLYKRGICWPVYLNGDEAPIMDGEAYLQYYYTDSEGTAHKYEFLLRSRQPLLTSLTSNESVMGGKVKFASGGAAWNDNRSALTTYPTGQNTTQRLYTLANISEELEGASMFILPWVNTSDADDKKGNAALIKAGNETAEMFKFTAEKGGRLVVLMANDASDASQYKTDTATWTADENNGTDATGINASSARNKNDYTNRKYFAMAHGWNMNTNLDVSAEINTYRRLDPGLTGTISNTHVANSAKLKYAYYTDFAAGEEVSVYNTGSLTSANNASNSIAIFVIWDTEPAVVLDGALEAENDAINNTAVVTGTLKTVNMTENDYAGKGWKWYAAVYDTEGKMLGVGTDYFTEGASVEITLDDCQLTGTETVKIFVLDSAWKPVMKAPITAKASEILAQ